MIPADFRRAFERNCPHVRLTRDEREELDRLFYEAMRDAMGLARRRIVERLKEVGDDG